MAKQDVKAEVRKFLLDNFSMGDRAVVADGASFMDCLNSKRRTVSPGVAGIVS